MITNPLAIIAIVLGAILLVPMICRKIRIPSIVGFIIVGILVGEYGFGLLPDSSSIQTLGTTISGNSAHAPCYSEFCRLSSPSV